MRENHAPHQSTLRTRRGLSIAAAALLVVASGMARPGAARAGGEAGTPNVLLIAVDTLRRDHCSAYGYANETTPVLSAVAAAGARFDRAYAPSSETAPTHASIFTGLYPVRHRLVKNGLDLGARHQTLAERFAERGYQTAGFVSSFVLDAKFGWSQGFGHYDDEFDPAGATTDTKSWEGHAVPGAFDRRGEATTRGATRWLWERDRERPFFLFVHYFDPHSPYEPTAAFRERFPLPEPDPAGGVRARLDWRRLARQYDGEIAYADREIGNLLDVLQREGLTANTLVVITADHGEGLMDHGFMLHGIQLYEEAVRVPLVFRWPGVIAADQRFAEPVELVDLTPTILDLAGVGAISGVAGAAPRFQGRSLAPALRGGAPLDPDRAVHLYRRPFDDKVVDGIHVNGEQHAIRVGTWKLIVGEKEDRVELYNLESDAGEQHNTAHREPVQVGRLLEKLERWRETHEVDTPLSAVAEEDRKALEALGYSD